MCLAPHLHSHEAYGCTIFFRNLFLERTARVEINRSPFFSFVLLALAFWLLFEKLFFLFWKHYFVPRHTRHFCYYVLYFHLLLSPSIHQFLWFNLLRVMTRSRRVRNTAVQSYVTHFTRNFLFQWNLFTSQSYRIQTNKELLVKHKNGTSAVLQVYMILQIAYREATRTRKIVNASLLIVQRK